MLRGDIVELVGVLGHVVELPVAVVKRHARFVVGHDLPALAVEAPVASELRVLLQMCARGVTSGEDGGEAGSVDLLGRQVPTGAGVGESGQLQQCGGEVGDVLVLGADAVVVGLTREPLRPGDDQRDSDTTRIGLCPL